MLAIKILLLRAKTAKVLQKSGSGSQRKKEESRKEHVFEDW